MSQAERFKLESLLGHGFEALTWYTNHRVNKRNVTKFMEITRSHNLQKVAYSVLKEWTRMSKRLNRAKEEVEEKRAIKVRTEVFKTWLAQMLTKQVIDDGME